MKAVKYQIAGDTYIEKTGDAVWAIRQMGDVLNKKFEWEYEPMPSSRTEAFIKRTRFNSAKEAYVFWKAGPTRRKAKKEKR